jgi:hypothetical protein
MKPRAFASAAFAAWLAAGLSPALACKPYIEEHSPPSGSFVLRPNKDAFERCEVGEAAYREVVAEWLKARPPGAPAVTSLALGRAVAYPWISRHLADAALETPGWAAKVTRATPAERDKMAAALFRQPHFMQRLALPFEGTPYRVVGISFEKILWGKAGAVPVPFDAQLWLRLAPRSGS